jgi:hypothetical protein
MLALVTEITTPRLGDAPARHRPDTEERCCPTMAGGSSARPSWRFWSATECWAASLSGDSAQLPAEDQIVNALHLPKPAGAEIEALFRAFEDAKDKADEYDEDAED